ncbi:aldo/keto reductase [Tatumella sp. TA1]|uniref:aldo/keto reductase n=1 Tax=Rosenbergiella collisarenosi TaxID=1544695 RepID=UPI0008F83493|nr:aldo/keto reductase [Rosenbergiella collisarenosi]MBT0721980.1 aldo/keto reductase [Rosenbergiella collisarenosi]QGX92796.1 aldo/keto reductase [Tatumella sp. TA1]
MTHQSTLQIAGNTLPSLGMGSWRLGQGRYDSQQEIQALQRGLDLGLRVIDTAEMYGEGQSETLIGKAIADRRDQTYLVSKVYPWNATERDLETSLDASLSRLRTDFLDLYLLHWQSGNDLQEVVSLMEAMKAKGKIKAWGVSNFDLPAMQSLISVENGANCAVNQVFYNLAGRGIEYDLAPWCAKQNIAMMAYCPLGGAGSHLLDLDEVKTLAEKYHVSPATLLLAWVIRQNNILAIPESGSLAHVEDNARALQLTLNEQDCALLTQYYPAPQTAEPLEIR